MKKTYHGPAVKVAVENPEGGYSHIWIRPKTAKAIIPGKGMVSLPEYLAEQGAASIELEKVISSKKPAPVQLEDLRAKLTLPDLISSLRPGQDTSTFAVRSSETDFELDSVEEASSEIELLKKKIRELQLELEKSVMEKADSTDELAALRAELATLKSSSTSKTE